MYALRRDLRYAHGGALTSWHLSGQTEQAWFLAVLTNCVATGPDPPVKMSATVTAAGQTARTSLRGLICEVALTRIRCEKRAAHACLTGGRIPCPPSDLQPLQIYNLPVQDHRHHTE
jgi:hypothetical protein